MILNQPAFKPVYIFGAGTSKHIGAPLLKDFLATSKDLLLYKSLDSEYKKVNLHELLTKHYVDIFDWIKELYRTRHYLSSDFDDLENIFSLADMAYQLRSGTDLSTIHIRESLFSLISSTLELSINFLNPRFTAYSSIIHGLAYNDNSSFITFNYDTAIENALFNNNYDVDYCYSDINTIPFESKEAKIKRRKVRVLKLHGSKNWIYCPNCGRLSIVEDYLTYNINATSNPAFHRQEGYHQSGCSTAKCINLIIPPTWNKSIYGDVLKSIWNSSIAELKHATHILIVGYSFPKTDVYFQHLLTLGLEDNEALKQIYIINPDPSIKKEVEHIFDKLFFKKNINIISSKFEDLHGINTNNEALFIKSINNVMESQ